MLFAVNRKHNPAFNLALEEYLCGYGKDVFMLWRNEPAVIIGRFQDVEAEVDREFAKAKGIYIVRRNSGGGTVYHDLGNVNYSFILRDDWTLTLSHFAEVMLGTLRDIGIRSELEFRHNDILADGHKVSGMAQYHHDGVILHHGTLLFDTDIEVIQKVLRRCGDVANIRPLLKDDISVTDFMAAIRDNINIFGTLTLSQKDYDDVNMLMSRKYNNPQWNNEGENNDRV